MLLFLQILFWLSVAALLHTYLFYPFLTIRLAKKKRFTHPNFSHKDELPIVSVLMAVYNEEKVIQQKMDSLLALHYPKNKLHIYIGSDCSTDATNTILEKIAKDNKHIHFFPFQERNGKPGIINKISESCFQNNPKNENHILLMTDASVILQNDTLWHLVKHFAHPDIGVVDSNMKHFGMQKQGISESENTYINSEVLLKHSEGLLWGKMIGPFGGCYAIRSTYFSKVPPKFLVDDFYIAFRALEQNTLAINDLEAECYEAVSHEMREEYRRKARISAGNFQNLFTFKHLLNLTQPLGFAFFSHKILRWLGPFFILIMLICSAILAYFGNQFFSYLFYIILVGLIGIPTLDFVLKQFNIHIKIVRNISYFLVMNVALLHGFFNFLKGIQSNVWEPPKRI